MNLSVSIPAPGTYEVKTCFGVESPTIKRYHLTTDFRLQSARQDYDKVFVPGSRASSTRQMEHVPGPGTYSYKNQSIG